MGEYMGISFLTSPLSCLQQLDKMRGFIVALALISACAAVSRDAQWEEFKLTFKKGYRNLDQESERKGILWLILMPLKLTMPNLKLVCLLTNRESTNFLTCLLKNLKILCDEGSILCTR